MAPEDSRVMYAATAVRYNRFRKPVATIYPEGYELAFACAADVYEAEALPEDFANDKYLYINGEFVLNPDYDDGGGEPDPEPAPSEDEIAIDDIDEAYTEGVNSIDDTE